MILEGIVTSLGPDNRLNIAPMGPEIDPGLDMERFVLRPFRTSTTYANLKERGEGVLHITDDVLLLAQTAIGARIDPQPVTLPASAIRGVILADSCRYFEFRVIELDDRTERARMVVETVGHGRHRDFFGFNRAKHAVLEAAVLATRTAWLPLVDLLEEFGKLEAIVQKTGGPSEHTAFRILNEHLRKAVLSRGLDPDSRPSPP